MKRSFIVGLVLVANLLLSPLFGQIINPVSWKYSTKKISETEYELKVDATIENGWHLYAQDFPDGGPIPLVFTFEENSNVEYVGKVLESPKPHEEFDDIFEINVKFFDGKASFTQKIKIKDGKSAKIVGTVDGQACQESGQCEMVSDDIDVQLGKGAEVAEANDGGVVKATDEAKKMSLWAFFIASLLGGFIALLTPCIYPMIPMTVSYFMHNNESKAKSRYQAIVYGISIIAIFVVIGTIVAVIFGERFTNFVSTHWIPNILFFVLFMIFAASFFGMFEITLPSWMVNRSDKNADKGGAIGAFFMALTLVIVSFSCTAPIVGAILTLSAQGEVIMPIVGMLGFSLAFAIPFTSFAIFPSALQKLPQSGGWLNSVKVVLGFIELALGLKFLSVADQTYHWGLLDREIYLALWIVIFSLMGLYLLGKIKFAHDSDVPFIKVPRLIFAIITFTFVVYLIPGMFGAPLKALSGWLPPQATHDFDLNAISRNNTYLIIDELDNMEVSDANSSGSKSTVECEAPKYADKLHLPHGIKGYFDMDQALACAKAQNKPIFVDFTGHGCVNCREMENNVWSDPKVLKKLKKDYIVVALYVDEKTIKFPEEDWTKDSRGKWIKSLDHKNAHYQASKFGSNAQPYYVLLGHNEEMLVKDARSYDLDVNAFVDFLDRGLEEFNKKYKN